MAEITPFIVIGSKGTGLPLEVRSLRNGRHLGFNRVRWAREPKDRDADELLSWIGKANEEIEILERKEAVQKGRVKALPANWVHEGRGSFSGTAFIKQEWDTDEKSQQYVAVDCPAWGYGWVETKSVRKGNKTKNAHVLVRLEFTDAENYASTMEIPFAGPRSDLVPALEQQLRPRVSELEEGMVVTAELAREKAGYAGQCIVRIDFGNTQGFITNLPLDDPTRFPARIKAAATVLKILGLCGLFQIGHRNGTLTLLRLIELEGALEGFQKESTSLISAIEGGRRLVTHYRIERNAGLAAAKKATVLEQHGRLECECCRFDFFVAYGAKGEGFCEVHHRQPLSELDKPKETALEDLAVVCANCHRMLHRGPQFLSVEELRAFLLSRGAATA